MKVLTFWGCLLPQARWLNGTIMRKISCLVHFMGVKISFRFTWNLSSNTSHLFLMYLLVVGWFIGKTDKLELSWIILGYLGIFWVNLSYLRLSWVISGYLGLSWVILGYIKLSWVILGYIELSQVILGYLETLGYLGLSWVSFGLFG